MPDTRELEPVAEAAEHAAALGDYSTAERLLRELTELQESRLGPQHPDLANTFNNLGVVCDFADKPDQAEQCYRRALSIAKAAFAPDHSFVVTSEKNLRDFCAARGRPFEVPAETTPSTPEERLHVIDLPDTLEHFEAERAEPATGAAASAAPTSRPTLLVVGVAALVFVVAIVAIRSWFVSNARSAPVQATTRPPAAEPTPTTSVPPVIEASTKAPTPIPPPATPPKSSRPSSLPEPTVATARLCRSLATESRALGDWPCENPGSPAAPGPIFFYTRVRSARDTTVEHRWYNDAGLLKVVELQIRSSPTDGYRTYSRNTVDGRNGGEWRVELRTKDGVLLHEERLTVRHPS